MVNDMNKNLCTMCSSSNICDIYTFDACPLFQNRIYHSFYAAKNATCGPVVLSQCECGFVFNRLFDYGLMNYDEDYDNDQSNSDFFLCTCRRGMRSVRSEMLQREENS